MGALTKETGGTKRQEEDPEEFLGPSDAWMERIDGTAAVVRWRAGYLEGGRFHPRQAASSSQIARSLTAVEQNKTAAQHAVVLHSWTVAAYTERSRGRRRLGDATCTRSCRIDHAHRDRMESTLAEGFGLNAIVLLYSMAVALGGTAGKATGQGRRTRNDPARRAGRVARTVRVGSSSLHTAASNDEMNQAARRKIDWLARPWRLRRRRCS